MKIQHIVLTGVTVMLLTTSSVWAKDGEKNQSNSNAPRHEQVKNERGHGRGRGHVKAPEIDAASGTSAIALLTGVLLLAGEKSRSRRRS